MAKIKFDVSGSDPKNAFKGGFVAPKPGVYRAKIVQCKLGHKRDDDSVERLEIIVEIQDKAYKGARLYDYIGFDDAQAWKMDQFLQVLGVASAKKRKGQFDTDDAVGQTVKVRVKGDQYQGEYQAKLNAWMPDEDSDDEDEDFDEDEEESEEEEDDSEEEEESDEEEEDEEESEDDESEDDDYTYEDLAAMDAEELTALAEEYEVNIGKLKKKDSILAKLAGEWGLEPSEEEEEEDDDDEEPF